MSTVEATTPTVTASPVTTLTTTVRMIRPSTSSATAAPSTMRASVVASARRSPNTRAVMPTLVAVSAAPRKIAVSVSQPRPTPAPAPATNGTATPMTATSIEARPTRPSSARSISMPTWTSSSSTPSSASMPRLTPRSPPSSTRPSTDGPMRMPATISPSTAGIPSRSAPSAASLAAAMTIEQVEQQPRQVDGLHRRRARSAEARDDGQGQRHHVGVEPPPPPADGDDGVGPRARRMPTRAASQRRGLRSSSPASRRSRSRSTTRPPWSREDRQHGPLPWPELDVPDARPLVTHGRSVGRPLLRACEHATPRWRPFSSHAEYRRRRWPGLNTR